MRILSQMVLTVALAALMASPVLAQGRRGGGRGGRGGIGMLLNNEGVQKELKLDEDTQKKAKEVVTKVQDSHKEDQDKISQIEDRKERGTKQQELTNVENGEVVKGLDSVLTKEQLTRLKQIQLQTEGTRAFSTPEVAKALSLKDDQKDKIKEITDDEGKQMSELRGGGGGGGGRGNFEKMASIRKEAVEKAVGVLNDSQKKTWKNMTGEPFTLQMGGRRGNRN